AVAAKTAMQAMSTAVAAVAAAVAVATAVAAGVAVAAAVAVATPATIAVSERRGVGATGERHCDYDAVHGKKSPGTQKEPTHTKQENSLAWSLTRVCQKRRPLHQDGSESTSALREPNWNCRELFTVNNGQSFLPRFVQKTYMSK